MLSTGRQYVELCANSVTTLPYLSDECQLVPDINRRPIDYTVIHLGHMCCVVDQSSAGWSCSSVEERSSLTGRLFLACT